jgi:hypothetical protein
LVVGEKMVLGPAVVLPRQAMAMGLA